MILLVAASLHFRCYHCSCGPKPSSDGVAEPPGALQAWQGVAARIAVGVCPSQALMDGGATRRTASMAGRRCESRNKHWQRLIRLFIAVVALTHMYSECHTYQDSGKRIEGTMWRHYFWSQGAWLGSHTTRESTIAFRALLGVGLGGETLYRRVSLVGEPSSRVVKQQ